MSEEILPEKKKRKPNRNLNRFSSLHRWIIEIAVAILLVVESADLICGAVKSLLKTLGH